MIVYGDARQLLERWCGKDAVALRNDSIAGNGGMVSAEPVGLLQEMARLSSAERRLIEYLTTGDTTSIRAELEGQPDLARLVGAYLAKFGDRTFNELKLESLTLHDDPLPLFRAIGIVGTSDEGGERRGGQARDRCRPEDGRSRCGRPRPRRPSDSAACARVGADGRRATRPRPRESSPRADAAVRTCPRHLSRDWAAASTPVDLLEHPRDVFYLEVGELLAFVDGRSTTSDLRPLVASAEVSSNSTRLSRRLTHASRRAAWSIRGIRYQRVAPSRGGVSAPKDERRGLGCSPGVARGRVCVVHDPRSVNLGEPAILVARHTDPGWILVFPSALAVIVERGSPFRTRPSSRVSSASRQLCRSLGATEWLEDGAWVEVDGSAGIVRRIPQPNPRVERSLPTESAVAHA